MLDPVEYKSINVNDTFGDDENITNHKWKPILGLAEGEKTLLVAIPVKVIE